MPFLAGYVTPQDYGAVGNGVADDTTAIQAALNAVTANGSTVFFSGKFLITASLTAAVTGTQIVGNGWGTQILYDGSVVTAGAFKATAASTRVFIRDLRISQTNASHLGTAIDGSNFANSTIERVLIDGGGASGVAPLTGILMNAGTSHYNEIRACRINYGGASSAGISLTGGSHSNTVIDVRLIPQGDDAASSGVYVANTHSCTLIHPDVENAAGNGIWLDTAAHGTTIINPYCELNNIGLKITSGVIAPTVTGGTIQSSVTANVQDNGAASPSITNAWPNSSTTSYNHVAVTNADAYSINGVPVPAATFQASDQNLLTWSFDPNSATNSSGALSTGVLHLIKVNLRYAATVTNVLYNLTTLGATLTSGQNFVGVYDSTGVRKGVSADLTTSWNTGGTTGLYTTPLAASFSAAAGTYYVAILCNGTTGPIFARATGVTGAAGLINAGLTAANYRFATNGSSNTSMPTPITLSSNAQEGVGYWVALS